MARVDHYQNVTDLIVAELEKGVAPWVRPWKSLGGAAGGPPFNGYTSRAYRGVNIWILVVTAVGRSSDRADRAGHDTALQRREEGGVGPWLHQRRPISRRNRDGDCTRP